MKQSYETTVLERLGRQSVMVGDLPDLQIEFLEELCKLWPYTLDRYYATRDLAGEEQAELLAKIAFQEKPILDRAKFLLKVLLLIRTQYEEAITLASEDDREKVIERCSDDPAFFVNMFCYIHEPRMPEIGLSADLPFIMYPDQQRIFEEVEAAYRSRQDLLIEKSREAGITWSVSALAVHHFRFIPGWTAIFGSEKEEKVDLLNSKKPIFGKIRHILYTLPKFLRPSTFEKEDGPNDNYRRLSNPDNKAEISGEAGLNIGRSGRASMVFIDEAQAITTPEALDSALESVVNCRIDIGTPLGMNHFGRKRHSGKVKVISIPWWTDPRKNPKWRENKKNLDCAWRMLTDEKREKHVVAQEYDLDYYASVEGLYIESKWVQACIEFDIPAEGDSVSGFDPSGSGPNESMYAHRIGPVVKKLKSLPYKTTTDALWAAMDEAEADNVGGFNYDLGGIGESIWGQVKASGREIKFVIRGIDTGLPASDTLLEDEGKIASEKFRPQGGTRAEIWWELRTRARRTFEHRNGISFYPSSQLISIPNDPVLIAQLCAPKIVYTAGGKIGVESKKDMKARGIKSPDRADAVGLAFYDRSRGSVISEFDYTDTSSNYSNFDIDHTKAVGDSYAVIYQADDMKTYVLCCLWRGPHLGLQVYNEVLIENGMPEDVIAAVYERMEPGLKHIREWIANDEMFKGYEDGRHAAYRLYRKLGVILKRNYTDDVRGSRMLTNQMFRHGMIQVHRNCTGLFAHIREWKDDSKTEFGYCKALCLIVTRLRKLRKIYIEEVMPGSYGRPPLKQRKVA